ncbi:MAG: PP2C family protein-serine/threonine phosphatase [Egibacteraceae bacterium]
MTSALAAVAGLAHAGERQTAPACTYISAVVTAGTVTVGWVGDSRAYWIVSDPATLSRRLTVDDSWVAEMVASGVLSQAEAESGPLAHAITAWLGVDAGDVLPHVMELTPEGPGLVVVCSDGLWNYLDTAEMVGAAIPAGAAEAPLAAARELVRVALQAGGHDNVTVAVLPFTGGVEHR